MILHEAFMSRCLDLAVLGMGSVSPNPMVGAVLVHEGRIIGEGYHELYGGPHAEVQCINSVKAEDQHLIAHSTMYVSLEPCAHHGKTPPCADLIIDRGIRQVVTGSSDPNPLVAGRGIRKLSDAGVNVKEHILRKECDSLNKRFMTYHTRQRPYIILKWAQSADGFFAPEGGKQLWLTNEYSKKLVHKWRTEEDAILIGTNTALIDDPQLTARLWTGNSPIRILIDMGLKVPITKNIFNDDAMTLVYNRHKEGLEYGIVYVKLDDDHHIPSQIAADLYHRKVQSVIIEGGAATFARFIAAGLWDEARIFISPAIIGAGITAPHISGPVVSEQKLSDDTLIIKMQTL